FNVRSMIRPCVFKTMRQRIMVAMYDISEHTIVLKPFALPFHEYFRFQRTVRLIENITDYYYKIHFVFYGEIDHSFNAFICAVHHSIQDSARHPRSGFKRAVQMQICTMYELNHSSHMTYNQLIYVLYTKKQNRKRPVTDLFPY